VLQDVQKALAQPAQEPVAEQFKFWSVTGKYERQAFASLASAEAYCKGLNTKHPEGNYVVRPLQEITKACTDERMCVPCYTGQGTCETTPPLPAQPAQDPEMLTIVYQSGYHDGKQAALAGREWNFCERCGKRTADLTIIHTCTPPQGDS
jgi:hypothetical protein